MNRFVPDENFLARWTSGELSEAELAEWKASPEYIEYMRILDTSAALELPATRDEADMWEALSAKVQEAPVISMTKTKKIAMPRWVYAAAAAVALMFALFIYLPQKTTHQTLAAQTETISLPDGSIVHLHASSRISYEDDWEDERSLNLEGEAFFEVKKGSKFTVNTQQGTVEVLGTSFNIKSRKEAFSTTCYTGKVRVATYGTQSEKILTPGLATKLDGEGELNQVELELNGTSPGWMKGKYRFRNDRLVDIISEFERIFDAKIDLEIEDDRKNSKHNFTILSNDLKTELENLSKVITGGLDLVYEADKQIRILPMTP